MNTVDLHIHSTHSDGSLSPAKIVELAFRSRMQAIAITDHDTLSHVTEIEREAKSAPFDVLAGVEVSAQVDRGTMHMLGYCFDARHPALVTMLQEFRDGRDVRNPRIIEKLNKLGVAISYDDVVHETSGGPMGRVHIARVLVKMKAVGTIEEAFTRYLAKGAAAYVERKRFSAEHIIAVIKQAGGVSYLAHPKQLLIANPEELERLVQHLKECGLDGIETYNSSHTRKETKQYLKLAERYELLIAGGSDFHGTGKPHIGLGYVGPGVEIPYSVVERMKERAKRI